MTPIKFLEKEEGGGTRIFTGVSGPKHFIVLRYDIRKADEAFCLYEAFNVINKKFHLGDSWLFKLDGKFYSISMRLFNWQSYKAMLFHEGVNRQFRDRCLKDRGCHLYVGKEKAKLLGQASERSLTILKAPMLNKNLKCLLFEVIFGHRLGDVK